MGRVTGRQMKPQQEVLERPRGAAVAAARMAASASWVPRRPSPAARRDTLLQGAAPAAGQASKGRRNPEAGMFTEEPPRRSP